VRLLISLALVGCCASPALAQRQPAGDGSTAPNPPQRGAAPQAPIRAVLAQPKPQQLRAPFKLTPDEERELDRVLADWEKAGMAVKTFKCEFLRLEYDAVFGAKGNQFLRTEGEGKILFKRPDWGEYDVTKVDEYVPPKPPEKKFTMVRNPDLRERWVCDGKSIFQFDYKKKQVTETRLPKEMQGPAIADGPIPFVFGTKADQIKNRYFVKVSTPPGTPKSQIWLDVWPRWQADAANFEKLQVILNTSDFMPYALQMFLPGGKNKTVYKFENISTNSKFSELVMRDFTTPATPAGWKKVVEDVPSVHKDTQAPAADPASARRAGDGARR